MDPIAILVNAAAADLRERGYTIVDFATRTDHATVNVTTRPNPDHPYQIYAAAGPLGSAKVCCFAHSDRTTEALARAFSAWLPKVPDLVERERLLDMTLGIEPARAEAA